MLNKELGICPECGSETVVENEKTFGGYSVRVERCDGLVEIDPNSKLEACTWSQDLDDYYLGNNISSVSGVGIIKK